MNLVLYSWNGHLINDGTNFRANIPPGLTIPTASPDYIDRGDTWPFLAGKSINGATFTLKISVVGEILTQWDKLKYWFRTDDFDYHQLIAKDIDDSDRQWYVEGFAVTPPMMENSDGGSAFSVTLALKDPIWREVTQSSDTWSITASGQTKQITARGNYPTSPIITVTPTNAKTGGYAYKRFVIVRNPTAVPMQDCEICLTGNSGMDTTGLVSGGKMLANGDDLRAIVDGVELDRWVDAPNTANTRVVVVMSLSGGISFTLPAITGTPASITLPKTTANANSLKLMKSSGMFQAENELIAYSNLNPTTRTMTITERGAKGTTAANHALNTPAYIIEHDVWLMYGNALSAAQETNNAKKPIPALSTLPGTLTYTEFRDDAGLRVRGWKPSITAGKNSLYYTGNELDYADPATEAGAKIAAYQSGAVWKGESGSIEWRLYHPAGFTGLSSASGEKFRVGTSWPAAKLQKSKNGTTWVDVATIATPSAVNTWQAWTQGAVSFGTGPWPYVRFSFIGAQSALANGYAACEVDAITLTVDATALPIITVTGEQSNYTTDMTITVVETGEAMSLNFQTALNQAVTVDCEAQTVTGADGQDIHLPVVLNTKRGEWLRLLPSSLGATTLKFEDAGATAITFVTKWNGKNFI